MIAPPPHLVIVGAGPAGMMLAYQLVSNGVPVSVLEQQPEGLTPAKHASAGAQTL